MAWYTAASILHTAVDDKPWWQGIYFPGDIVSRSGIYRCLGCGREIASNEKDPFPPQNHHQHRPEHGKIRWKLNVAAAGDGHS